MASGIAEKSGTVLYLYGITKESLSFRQNVTGVDGSSVIEPVECGGLTCWVSRVPAADYAESLSSNMENLDWLAAASVRHQKVLAALAGLADVLPARFGTVFLSVQSLAADVTSRKRTFEADFRKIQGCDEWGIKIFVVPKRTQIPAGPARSGKDYLKAKAALLQSRPTKSKISSSDLQPFSQELHRLAVDTASVGKVSGGQRGLEWQTSILLRRPDRKKLESLLRKYSKLWAGAHQIECTGPWPPYSFVSAGSNS